MKKFLATLVCLVSVFSVKLVYCEEPWSIEEDMALLNCVEQSCEDGGKVDWEDVSEKVFKWMRFPYECERRFHHLKYGYDKKWTKEEIMFLFRLTIDFGTNRWKELEQYFKVPAVFILKIFNANSHIYKKVMKSRDDSCVWVPRFFWVDDSSVSD